MEDLSSLNRVKIMCRLACTVPVRPVYTRIDQSHQVCTIKIPNLLEGQRVRKHKHSHAGKRKKMGGATLSATRLPWGRQPEFPSRWDNKDIQNPKSKYFVKLSEGQLRVTMKQTTKNLNKNIRVQEGCKDLAICGTTPYLPTPTPLSTPHRACIDSHQLCLFSRISVIQPQQTD